MKIRNNKNLIGFLKTLINFSLILVILFFQFFIPINSDASCSNGQPVCPSGQNYICPSGQAPCCLFSDESGCSNGLSCYGGVGYCGTTSTTSSTSSTTGGVTMCGGDTTPDCPSGQNYICPSGAAPCCIQFSDEAGCSYGLSCYGGQGFCGTSTTSSTSSTTGGVTMCGGDNTPDCPSGQNYICPSGQAPCCIQFSDEAGCSTGLSCYGARGFCGTSTTSSTSSTTGGVTMCGGDTTPDCPSGQNYICPSGAAPCCIQFSDEAGCSYGLSCYGGQGFCGTSSTSSTSSSSGGSSSSSSSSGSLVPYCSGGQIMCDSGTPTCPSGLIPDCGSNYGLLGQFSGQGCITPSMTLFLVNSVSCTPAQRIFTPIKQVNSCKKEGNLCPAERGRFKSCREDKASCKCVCQFETKKQKVTPHCDINNTVACSNSTRPACSKSSNIPVCLDGKLICRDRDTGAIDLVDIISCKKK